MAGSVALPAFWQHCAVPVLHCWATTEEVAAARTARERILENIVGEGFWAR